MPLKLISFRMFATFAAVALSNCACVAQPLPRTPVEVWRGGDDGLTSRFGDAVNEAFRASSTFTLSYGNKPGTLIVTIPTNVSWKPIGTRTQVTYAVTFATPDQRSLGSSTGTCFDDALSDCAAHILRDAQVAVKASR
ncbi:MAG TPA: hypothetical protein VG889_18150 [Rhizomicrobium sp.]|nr:hypothetical protein [Rhizomicrobium sp.]